MLDFASALYLGFDHASGSLPSWKRLTLGKPAALEKVPGTLEAQRALAELTGCEKVLLGPSTLHLFCDLFGMLARRNIAIWIDRAAYPIARWATDRAAALGTPVRTFAHHSEAALRRALGSDRAFRPVIVTDGFCPDLGKHAPLPEYARCAAEGNGLLIVDDTQALGLFGRGGGGSLPYFNHYGLRNSAVVVVSSLAKAFGAPVAIIGGSKALVKAFRENSASSVHCSPPSAPTILATLQALNLNRRWGNVLRRRLAERVLHFRRGVPDLVAADGLFPVQPLQLPAGSDARVLYRELLGLGVRPVLQQTPNGGDPRISFVITARHRLAEIDRAVESLQEALTAARAARFGHAGIPPLHRGTPDSSGVRR
jgi:8-amino-7-oxononanoate synthase